MWFKIDYYCYICLHELHIHIIINKTFQNNKK